MEFFLSGEVAIPKFGCTVHVEGTEATQLPSLLVTGFVSAALAMRPIERTKK